MPCSEERAGLFGGRPRKATVRIPTSGEVLDVEVEAQSDLDALVALGWEVISDGAGPP